MHDIVSILIFNGHESRRFSIYYPENREGKERKRTNEKKYTLKRRI